MKRKFISLMAVMGMLLMCAPISTHAEIIESGTCGENVTWTFDDEGTITISGTGEMEDFIDGSPWEFNSAIKKIIVEEGVTTVGGYSFIECENLESVKLPDGLKTISHLAFSDCPKLTDINIPDSVENIFPYAMQEIGYFNNPDNWEDNALYMGKNLIKVKNDITGTYTVKEGTRLIGGTAFLECSELSDIIIPNSVEYICMFAFEGCTGLTQFTISDKVTRIQGSVFTRCSGLTSIIIPESVTEIGDGAFDGCSSLTEITLPPQITSIRECLFSGCTGLTDIIIPQNVTDVEYGAFWACENLESITIPKSVKSIGEHAFIACDKLKEIYYSGTEQEWNEIELEAYIPPEAIIHYNFVYPTPTPTPTPTPEPSDRIELTQSGDTVTAKLIFEKTTPPSTEDMRLYVAYFANGILKRLEMPSLKNDMAAEFTIPEQLSDCDIITYAWDKDMVPLCEAKPLLMQ